MDTLEHHAFICLTGDVKAAISCGIVGGIGTGKAVVKAWFEAHFLV